MPLTPLSDPDVLFRENWRQALHRGPDGTPLVPPRFVGEAGPRLWVLDLRGDAELTGAQGHIPGVHRLPQSKLAELPGILPQTTPIVLVSGDGDQSMVAAKALEALGYEMVAAMAGGMAAWREAGFEVSRDEGILERLPVSQRDVGADGRPLHVEHQGGHLSRDAIESHIGAPGRMRRVTLASLLLSTETSCVDGREDRAILGTPGGDAGELLLALAATEDAAGAPIDLGHVPTLVRAFADRFRGVYLHTDNNALNTLARSIQADPALSGLVAGFSSASDWVSFLRRPPAGARRGLLDHLVQRDHVGCGHIKLALGDPEHYHIRPDLITTFFRAFYTDYWDGAPHLSWVILGGGHAEGAVVNITVEGEVDGGTRIPMVSPNVSGVQMFVNHPQAVGFLRDQTARFITQDVPDLCPGGTELSGKLPGAIAALGEVQMGNTLSALAKGLPIFEARFRGSAFTVEEAGKVG